MIGEGDKALECHNKGLKITTKAHGVDHLSVAGAKNNVATVHAQQGHTRLCCRCGRMCCVSKRRDLAMSTQTQPKLKATLRLP